MLTYAVGDVHGCLDHLADLLAQIERDARGQPRRYVFLGDYIDRGPDSAGVIHTVRKLQASSGHEVVTLKGNHEDLLLRSLAEPDMLRVWLYNGGDTALDSFAVSRPTELAPEVLAWVAALLPVWEDDLRCFVHAGLNPASGRTDQTDHDRLWIREPFLDVDHDFGKLVVHGHTPRRDARPEMRPHRLNLDTGAVFGGKLTAAIFEDDAPRPVAFLQSPR